MKGRTMSSGSGLHLPPFRLYHAAYVAQDMTRGTQRLAATHGLNHFDFYNGVEIGVPGGVAIIDVALGHAGSVPIEVIVPCGGVDAVYRNALPKDDDAVAFHHFCSRVETDAEWEQVLAIAQSGQFGVPVRGSGYGARGYVYLDTRPVLGHMLEFLYEEGTP